MSPTSVVGKRMESLVRDYMVDHIVTNKIFSDAQHGFVPGRYFMTQLLVVIELWTEILDSDDPVDAIYCHFSEVFVTLSHQILLNKLKIYGRVGDTNYWIRVFLTGLTHLVLVNSSLSPWLEGLRSIPQGSVLEPILFILFIHDLHDMVRSTAHIFADNTKVYRTVQLQGDVTKSVKWSEKWQM